MNIRDLFPVVILDLSKCKLYYSRSGAAYKDFFEISEEALVNGTLDFHFSVLAGSNAHVLLAPSSSVEKGDPAYEIVIGAGGNVFSDIRRSQKSQVKATKQTPGILSGLDLTSFWIHISSGEEYVFPTPPELELVLQRV